MPRFPLFALACSLAPVLAAALVATLVPATAARAQTGSGTEPVQVEASSGEAQTNGTGTAETATDPAAGAAGSGSAEPPAPAAVATAECAWIGQRVLMLLWRDDIDTANDFFTVYDRFGCPMGHAGPAFRCLVALGASPDDADLNLPDRARACWENPGLDPADYVPPAQVAPQVE